MAWTEMYVGIVQAAVLLGYRCVRRALRHLAPPLGLCGISATSKVTRCVCVCVCVCVYNMVIQCLIGDNGKLQYLWFCLFEMYIYVVFVLFVQRSEFSCG